jgi:signal transduction histidine kinase
VALFRIVQETLNNTAKHARATEVNIKLIQSNEYLTLEITDNGVGFDVNDKKKADSYGLLGMKERVFLLGGELKISSTKDVGTTIKVKLKSEYIMIGNA